MDDLPSGTVTFLFTDIEGSTRLLHELGDGYAEALVEHRRLLRQAFVRHGGVEVDTQGDAFFVAFSRASDAVAAARDGQASLAAGPIGVRMGIHTGEPLVIDGGYVGIDVHRAARIAAIGHGGQVLLSQATRDLAGAQDVLDLGEHRLKDLTAAERVYQLGRAEFGRLNSLGATNLPVAASPLVGRRAELAELAAVLRRTRLLTITGPGGTGKTRVALQLAADASADYRDGVVWVPLASLADADLVLPTIAETLDVKDDVVREISGKRILLVLDNLEHLLECTPGLSTLLSSAAGLTLLVTSRAPLHLSGEEEYALGALSDPEAIELFLTRARAVRRDVAADDPAVAVICRRLEGLPLAIELAAARARLLEPGALLLRLDKRIPLLTGGPRDVPTRQRTLAATIDWSYDLMTVEGRELFAQLSVFSGGFSLKGAEEICECSLDDLASLVDMSLLKPIGDGRFLMLETLREYAAERLDPNVQVELRRRVAVHFHSMAPEAWLGLRSPDQAGWLTKLHADLDNLRAVLAWSLEHDVELGLEVAFAMADLWQSRGLRSELVRWFETAFDSAATVSTSVRADALNVFGGLLLEERHYERARVACEESLALCKQIGHDRGQARALIHVGTTHWATGDFERATPALEEAVAISRRLGEPRLLATALHHHAENVRGLGDYGRATELHTEAAALAKESGFLGLWAATTHSLADTALDLDDPEEAADRYADGLRYVRGLGDEQALAMFLAGFAAVAAMQNDAKTAGQLWGAVEAIEERLNAPLYSIERSRYERMLNPLEHDNEFRLARHRGRSLTPDEAVALALQS